METATENLVSALQSMNNSKDILISFVIPCYNSSKSLKVVTKEILNTLKQNAVTNYEIILVNDNSSDSTLEIIKKLCDNNERFIGINLSNNFGQQQAMLAGFNHAEGSLVP